MNQFDGGAKDAVNQTGERRPESDHEKFVDGRRNLYSNIRRIYVAGPYTKGDVALNVRAAILAGDDLISAGFFPFIPHLSHFQHLLRPRQYEDWMKIDLEWLCWCNALLRLPGESAGADRECIQADALGMPIFYGSALDLISQVRG